MRGLIERMGWLALWLLIATSALPAAQVRAQAPDMREIFPYLMLLIDTSGSMERLPACSCLTVGCDECLPHCELPNDTVTGLPPKDPMTGHELKKNRWAVTLEALTGEFEDFECNKLDRVGGAPFSYDLGYYLPYHQPWHCSTADSACAFSDTANNTLRQKTNGILDEYRGRVNFGLITFDGWDTWRGAPPLVSVNDFNNNLSKSNGEDGLWSYGGGKSFHYPNCTTDYMMDTGARSPAADQGSLISINSCKAGSAATCPAWCGGVCWTGDPSEVANQLNADIQNALLSTRPYGGTPIAASLDDLYHHLKVDLANDGFIGCRKRYALLMTDGYPDDDYRSFGCNCKNEGSPTITLADGGVIADPDYAERCGPIPQNDPNDMHCPYPTAEQAAYDLVHGKPPSDSAQLERLFVVGLAVDDNAVLNRLDAIADNGCPQATGCETAGHEALFATDLNTLVSTLSNVIGALTDPISRSVPVVAQAKANDVEQYQIGTGFEVPLEADAPWQGLIQRQRFKCTDGDLEELDVEDEDLLHLKVNAQPADSLNLYTALPTTGSQDAAVFGNTTGTPCGPAGLGKLSGCLKVSLKASPITNTVLGLGTNPSDDDRHIEIMDWMYGEGDSVRVGKEMGDIYHSSPVVLGVPRYDSGDEAFNEFRETGVVTQRPLTMFVGTNDGMLRAISVEEYTATAGNLLYPNSYDAGQQMWGFVPPMMMRRLEANLVDHRITMDGTPVVKNVYFSRAPGVAAAVAALKYHTVLITGMRGGGNGYLALDVTNPTDPQFLWQFTDPQMGKTYAQPAIAQASFDTGSGVKNGAIAILSGGVGLLGNSGVSGDCVSGASESMKVGGGTGEFESYSTQPGATSSTDIRFRSQVHCWQGQGRSLYFVDVETGQLIKKIYLDPDTNKLVFPSPIVSTPAIFQSDIGTRASRAFVVDADGVVWRIDLTASDPKPTKPMEGWTARPFHDIFWTGDGTAQDGNPSNGEASYEAPLLSVDDFGRVVVIVGTGDTDNFAKVTAQNRVVSLTELIDSSPLAAAPPENVHALLNWEKRVKTTGGFVPSELVTGSMGLFARQLFFGSFIAVSGGNACDLGKGRVHAVDYITRDLSDANDTDPPTYGPKLITTAAGDSDSASIINVDVAGAETNLMIMGLGITQRPSCALADPSVNDPWSAQSIPTFSQLNDPALFLVAQGSGDHKSSGSLLKSKVQGGLLSVELKINRPKTPTRVVSWATSVD